MIRATTPLQEFVFTDDPDTFAKLLITYSQEETIILEKTKSDLAFTRHEDGVRWIGAFRMTQEETNLFDEGAARVQVRVLTELGEAFAGVKSDIKVEDVLNDEVLEDET